MYLRSGKDDESKAAEKEEKLFGINIKARKEEHFIEEKVAERQKLKSIENALKKLLNNKMLYYRQRLMVIMKKFY